MDKSKPNGKQTLVEEGTELKGTLKSTCQVVVNGAIDGQISAPSLIIAQSGTVLGTVKATTLRSEGTLAGDIDADDVYLSGTVRSNTMIRAKRLEVKLSQEKGKLEVSFGECLIEVGDDPAHAATGDAAAAAAPKPADEVKTAEAPPAAAKSAEAAAPADAAASGGAPSRDEPGWSEPPRDGDAEGGGRRKKNGERRDSQAPPP